MTGLQRARQFIALYHELPLTTIEEMPEPQLRWLYLHAIDDRRRHMRGDLLRVTGRKSLPWQ